MKHGPPDNTPGFICGNEMFQKVAREAFPILIQLATDNTEPKIFYSKLAEKACVSHIPECFRGLWMRKPLGSVWRTLFEYQQESGIEIPYLTTIVINKDTGIPTIFKAWLNWSDEKIAAEQMAVYNFKQWIDVMEAVFNGVSL